MARPSTILVVFMVSMNLFAGVLIGLNIDDTVGLSGQIHQEDDVPEQQTDDLQTGTGVGGTLFGMYNVLTKQVGGLYDTIYPAIGLMTRAGVPGEITHGLLGNLFTFIVFFDIVSYIRGWGL